MKSLATLGAATMFVALAGVIDHVGAVEIAAAQRAQSARSLATAQAALRVRAANAHRPARPKVHTSDPMTDVVMNTCTQCHGGSDPAAGRSFENFKVGDAALHAELSEKMIAKLRAGMMPPPGEDRPGGDTLTMLAKTLEDIVDKAAAEHPDPGARTFQRLNRAEYQRSIHDLLALDVDAGQWLPLDTKSANFDNIADVQTPSAMVLDAYLDAASDISRLAVGDPQASPSSMTYKLPRLASQWDQADGAPMGTRGGISVTHTFAADGQYVFAISYHPIPTGQLSGSGAPFNETMEVSIDGARVAMIPVDRGMAESDSAGMTVKTKQIAVTAGPHRVSAAFLRTFEGPNNDNFAPFKQSLADTQIGAQYGITALTHVEDLIINGPYNPSGVSVTPSRSRVFTCTPKTPEEARPCAQRIIATLSSNAYRRPVDSTDVKSLMSFYDQGAQQGGFEIGVRTALEAILASPHFVFRFESLPVNAKPGSVYSVSNYDLASRLSFFLWGAPPDSQLLVLARKGKLSDQGTLVAQARRMLADQRSEALSTRFAAQWLRLQDIDKVHPDVNMYPDFHLQLSNDMVKETELFFNGLVRENRNALELIDANYSYMNEDLADHYGIDGIVGDEFRKVQYPDDRRRGLLGQGSILTLTSHANRTSPVLRGKWVMEVLLGSPPPPPPPNVPDLEKTEGSKDGRMLTTRERMEQHRSNPQCQSCHLFMDPIGLALDNFDVTGQWRLRENDVPVDTRGQLYDGTQISSLNELQTALMKRPEPFVRTLAKNLMAYALGRRVEYYDGPAIRRIANDAAADNYKMDDFIIGVVKSDAFRKVRIPGDDGAAATSAGKGSR